MTYTEPLLTLFLAIVFVGWIRRRNPYGSGFVLLGLIGVFLSTWPPAAWVFSRPLEIWYHVGPFRGSQGQAIVVFSSGVEPPHWERPYALPGNTTYGRCRYAAWLYHHWRQLPVLACGGSTEPGQPADSDAMRTLLEESGVPPETIWIDEQSRSTHENAQYAARILQQHGIRSAVLVVEATSMPRAAACLRKAGILVTPAPSAFWQPDFSWQNLLPSWKAVRQNEATLHEMGGLAWYWIRGWI